MFKFHRHTLIFGVYLIVLVGIFQYVADALALPAWPAYMAMIFFFVEHMDPKKASHILVGGVAGFAGILLFAPFIGFFSPMIGAEASKIALILILVYAIVALGESLPVVFNAYAFMFLTIAGLALEAPGPNVYEWMGITVIGGAILIGGVILINKIMGPPPPTTPAT